jgi:heparan-sulfate lyase
MATFVLLISLMSSTIAAQKSAREMTLQSLKPDDVLSVLDLDQPGLEAAKEAAAKGDRIKALEGLLAYYRKLYPLSPAPKSARRADTARADQIVKHIFQFGPYEPADYGPQIDWAWDPRGDIEWVASVYRFYWALPLADAFVATGDEKYAKAFVEMASDWIAKHPLEKRDMTHPVYKSWRGFPWLDIQTGIRAKNLCASFKSLVHAKSFTPEFLGVLLASLYDHQVKTEKLPMGEIHNKAIFEQRGFGDVCSTMRIYKDTRRWMELAAKRTEESLLAQVTSDGVQREWSGGYHTGVLNDAVAIMQQMGSVGISVSDAYRDRVRKMYDYIFAIATPDLGYPMFGDTGRSSPDAKDRSRGGLYSELVKATDLLHDRKYAARAKFDRANLPPQTSYAFREAGVYALRNDWSPAQIYLALHCSPPALSSHDQPDNGTFELCAFGRWLMPDTGFYTYGHDAKGRAWHRQTSVHQTLTLDGKDTKVDGRLLLWLLSDASDRSDPSDTLVVENRSYPNLTHRRTVWFVDKTFFVLLDEAIGDAKGTLDLHFQLAPGNARLDGQRKQAATTFDDANVLVWAGSDAPVALEEEEGWFAWRYGHREPRPAFRFRHTGSAPAVFLTLVVPYRGAQPPEVSAGPSEKFEAGANRVALTVKTFGKSWRIGRDLDRQTAWCARD